MIENGVSGPSSLVYIQARESYPKKKFVFDDLCLSIPFPELTGENVEFLGKCSDATFAMSNFRFFAAFQHSFINIPLMLIENLELKGKECAEIFVSCKNGQSFQLKFNNADECSKWYERLKKKCVTPDRLELLFAFAYYAWCQDTVPDSPATDHNGLNCFPIRDNLNDDFLNEYRRMGFDKDHAWKITDINSKFELCSSYPKLHIVPSNITDEKLRNIAKFRASRRFPSAVWRHSENGAVIIRCSQPEVGWLYWRCPDDEFYLQNLGSVDTEPAVNGEKETLNNESDSSDDAYGGDSNTPGTNGFLEENDLNEKTLCNEVDKKVVVVDCRSYTVAFANRVKGGGSECTEYYPNCKIQFMGLANIHSIRKSFQSLRELCCRQEEQTGWLASLEATKWLSHISSLIKTALVVVKAVEKERQHVVVHCSDGWDRTPQVVALAQLLLDPFYRTIKGFRVLLEREWLAFGHKFSDRCGHGCEEDDMNERCPVFLQFLDCVHQLLRQFPCSFEFNETFLVKLAHHTYSCLYGTFLCNTEQERLAANIRYRTCSVWSMLESQSINCRNFLYSPREVKVLYPEYQVRNILLWSSLYLSTPLISFGNTSSLDSSDTALNVEEAFPNDYSRTELESRPTVVRRNSDGNVKVLSNDENSVGCSGVRDDSDLYLTKSLVCKAETNISPCLLANGFDRKSNENISENISSCGNNSFDHNRTTDCDDKMANGCENNSIDQNGLSGEDTLNSSKKVVADQNGVPANDDVSSSENSESGTPADNGGTPTDNGGTPTDSGGIPIEKSSDPSDSMASSSNTIVEDTDCSNTEEINVARSQFENGHQVSEPGVDLSPIRSVSKAINCRSNHRLNHFNDDTRLLQNGSTARHVENHIANSFSEFRDTPKSPKEMSFNKVKNCLDIDGLSLVLDPVQARLVKLERCYRERIEGLESKLLAQGCVCGLRPKVNIKHDMVANMEPTYEGSSSLSSNGTSDAFGSWERVDNDDVNPVLWVPDHHAVNCGGCDQKFTITIRKHHCRIISCGSSGVTTGINERQTNSIPRNCGKIFCGTCCNDMAPVPSEQLYDPVRVCKTCFEKLHFGNGQDIILAAS